MNVNDNSEGNQLVAYFDILGTKDRVQRGFFDDIAALDFASPAGIVARKFPSFRLAAFSDCVVMSAPFNRAFDFFRAVGFLTGNWSEDLVFTRGGIALGEIIWVDSPTHDKMFRLPNFACARVYGKALVEAITLESSSGPGVVTFVSDLASDLFEKEIPGSILRSQSNILVCLSQREIAAWKLFYSSLAARAADQSPARIHFHATLRVLNTMEKTGCVKFTPLLVQSEFKEG